MPIKIIRDFLKLEAASGILLFVTTLLALIVANSPWWKAYQIFTQVLLSIHWGIFSLSLPFYEWVNQGLMALFFLLISLEIKREIFQGELNSLKKISLPAIAAIGGMIMPALIYSFFNWHHAIAMQGWAIPTATDVAFSLAILNLLHRRIPLALKTFLIALAIFDDIGAILIIAIFYTEKISWVYLSGSLVCLLILFLFNHFKIKKLFPYLLLGIFLWLLLLQSGVHAVLAGVALAFAIPLDGYANEISPLKTLEKKLHPWVAFFILPLFGFVNAGVSFVDTQWQTWFNSVTLGVACGLLLGKQFGVFTATWLAVKFRLAHLPQQISWLSIYGIALICGVGFTMSLFIGMLAFANGHDNFLAAMRMGVFLGSLLSGLAGYCLLRFVHHD